ncbi:MULTISPECIES: NADPH-dependent 7-cyano-7-deazaguanine reductase QueF [unclassified Colwellia]|uniref:NADPH-dependent 7-cyano-7-deazaguanine reductase QueF n=1 Tax=unclassified Colwellia TaxID=196834 RepID=UPI0015F40913|nr:MULTISPECIES: NADPH-dependent 7-cyano-7-deazaguanine reductase QueF [unclassified Colwellia]MBA6233038.1 NADPH-dependent 7-cyano-7-deazaguanine reductase QueF [Colwellia sp. MB02u-7]MBA6236716.1 NADPH-dependent 7-cyano-7-deazaguanine reductase QueF [Colwellia sp. MB02u-11]MBA6255908.1 NADPH-dependent 7-cyano-7-deazaguanine reductase QueF [Colwellia sp. MB3u-28]MBA6262050.1 NADPH-dependent 7-cyano-7-deazaguanine reductase QueF [Colwellia sp. MB3u-41]MBA6299018.1 NADPH-dependent 7-cyano-7-dea
MTNYKNAKVLSQLTLGKATSYCSEYNPELLQAVPRSLNRDSLAISADNLPFIGEDVWYAYEISWLNSSGKPVVAVAEFRFPCTSPNIVESKSFKLYLNSFNQSRFSSWQDVESRLVKDLSNTSGSIAFAELFPVDNCPALNINHQIFSGKTLCIDDVDLDVENYQLDPTLLVDANIEEKIVESESLVSHLLKSNCLITNQPDWASIYIQYSGRKISQKALLAYLISFRQHNEFHEQCVERIYCDLTKYCQLTELTVFARYTRRGGLDINPFRSTAKLHAPAGRTLRQ